jgi:hypothetical protein
MKKAICGIYRRKIKVGEFNEVGKALSARSLFNWTSLLFFPDRSSGMIDLGKSRFKVQTLSREPVYPRYKVSNMSLF